MSITVFVCGEHPRKQSDPRGLTFDAPRIVLGRSEGCEVRLPDTSVSHRHASLRQRGAEYLLVDEASTNGTRLGRVRLAAHSPRVIQSGDTARIGRVWVEFRIDGTLPTKGGAAAAKERALAIVADALLAENEDARPHIVVAAGPASGASARLDLGGRLVVGRSSEAGLSIDDPDISRRHLEIAQRGDVLVVRDLGSKAGTHIGDREVATTDVVWKASEQLALGSTVLTYTFPAVEALAEIERSPDEKVPSSELEGAPEAEAVVAAPEEPIGELGDAPEAHLQEAIEDDAFAAPRYPVERPRVRWGATDFAVVFLALGVFCLSAVGYLVLLK